MQRWCNRYTTYVLEDIVIKYQNIYTNNYRNNELWNIIPLSTYDRVNKY